MGRRHRELFKAIGYRHDCVHRNCRDQDGKLLTVFTDVRDGAAKAPVAGRRRVFAFRIAIHSAAL